MLLFTPGPTPISEDIRRLITKPNIYHRSEDFKEIFKNLRIKLLDFLGTKDLVLLNSSGTGAMEACITNIDSKKILTINAGKFGARFSKICEAYNKNYIELKYEWNTPCDIKDIIKIIDKNEDIDTIALQIAESSGGLRHNIEEIAKELKKINKDIVIIADGITAVGVEHIDTKNIDFLISSSHKAFMLPIGLAFIGLSNLAISKLKTKSSYYFNLSKELKEQRENSTAYTSNTSIIQAFLEVLKKIERYTKQRLFLDTKRRAIASYKAIEALGLELYPKVPSFSMSVVKTKKADELIQILKNDFSVYLAGGQEHLKGEIFRINNMGFIKPYELSWVLNAIELSLSKLGIRPFNGEANKIFNKVYFNL